MTGEGQATGTGVQGHRLQVRLTQAGWEWRIIDDHDDDVMTSRYCWPSIEQAEAEGKEYLKDSRTHWVDVE